MAGGIEHSRQYSRRVSEAQDPAPVAQDSRGILDPARLQQRMTLTRHGAPPALADLVDRFWAVQWDFGPGESFRQDVLTHPGANISVSPESGGAVEARTTSSVASST